MRRFTKDELLIAGEPYIVDKLLMAVKCAVKAKEGPHRRNNRQLQESVALANLREAHEVLKRYGVNVLLRPSNGSDADRRRKLAADRIKKVASEIRRMIREDREALQRP